MLLVLAAANSGPSQYEYWECYASLQIDPNYPNNNFQRAGFTPLKNFV